MVDGLVWMWTRRCYLSLLCPVFVPRHRHRADSAPPTRARQMQLHPSRKLRASTILRNSRERPLTDSPDAQVRPPYRSWHERMGAMHGRPQSCLSSPCSAAMQCRVWTSRSMYHSVSLLFRLVSILRFVSFPRGLTVGSSTVHSGALSAIARL